MPLPDDPALAPIPNFYAEIADVWALLRGLSPDDLDRVDSWLEGLADGQRDFGQARVTLDDLPRLALQVHETGRHRYALRRAENAFRHGPPPPARKPAKPPRDATAALALQLLTLQSDVLKSAAALDLPRRHRRIARKAHNHVQVMLQRREDFVPGACRLLRLAIAHATEA